LARAERARASGVIVMDAPITGGASGAENGSLCYMLGGDAATVETVRPVFMTSAQKVIHAGDLGAGIALKLCNNLITYAEFIAIHEAGKLAEAAGLSLAVLAEVGQANGVITPQMQMFIENRNALHKGCSEADFKAIFGGFAALGAKDLQAALESAAQLNCDLPATTVNQTLIEKVFFNAY
jgi:3-hydroxyisobutyrate dehydrogenase